MDSLLELRKNHQLTLPKLLKHIQTLSFETKEKTSSIKDEKRIQELFPLTFGQALLEAIPSSKEHVEPLTVGVVLSGGQAAGGHNVIIGLYDGLKQLNGDSQLIGFLNGPLGIVEDKMKELNEDLLKDYKNTGGFDLIGSGRTKIETEEQFQKSLKTVQKYKLDGLVVIGGDDSNTNAALLAEYFLKNGSTTKVIGVPKTIDGDLKNSWVDISFGFDTACKTYSEMIGNIARDALSAKKYTHFIKLMGRSASHIALECALQTHPNLTLISEEVFEKKQTLQDITSELTDMIIKRFEKGKNYSVILIPEGLIEFIPEMKQLISFFNELLSKEEKITLEKVKKILPDALKKTFDLLPQSIQNQLLMDRDPHGNVQVSHIQTEAIFIHTVTKELEKRDFKGSFNPVQHFFGYEGRSGFPSEFDATYCYCLGVTAACLIKHQATGYMACVGNLKAPIQEWTALAVPLTALMNIETRKGKEKPVIQKALVNLEKEAFLHLSQNRECWKYDDQYQFPGPIQFFGDENLVNKKPLSLLLEK